MANQETIELAQNIYNADGNPEQKVITDVIRDGANIKLVFSNGEQEIVTDLLIARKLSDWLG